MCLFYMASGRPTHSPHGVNENLYFSSCGNDGLCLKHLCGDNCTCTCTMAHMHMYTHMGTCTYNTYTVVSTHRMQHGLCPISTGMCVGSHHDVYLLYYL